MHISFDIKFFVNIFEYTEDDYKLELPHLADNSRKFLLFLMYFSLLFEAIFKDCAVFYLNIKSGRIIKFLVKGLKYDRKRSTDVKLIIIMVFWLVANINIIIVITSSIKAFASFGYFHCFLSLALFFNFAYYCWIITFTICIFSLIYNDRLGKVIWNLKHFDKFERSGISSHNRANKTDAIKSIKLEYIEIRRDVTTIDSCLSFMIAFRILSSIYIQMVNAYDLSLISIEPNMKNLIEFNSFSTITSIAELVLMCFICGSLHSKSSEVNRVLDDFSPNILSDNECNQWLVLKNVCNNSEFGFTIGGFANLEKTTLIPV